MGRSKQLSVLLSAKGKWAYQGRQYIARIGGRDAKYTFRRDFIGEKSGQRREFTTVHVDDPGLYECCSIGRNGIRQRAFVVVIEHDGNMRAAIVTEQQALAIAKGLGSGKAISEVVTVRECAGLDAKGLPILEVEPFT